MFKHEKLHLLIFSVLVVLQLLGLIGLLTRFHLFYLYFIIPLFFWGGISTTLYLHRYLTHRGFEMPEWLKFLFATGSAVTLAGDPVTWVGDHRYHHLKSDTDEDIHSPVHGFPYAHMMWLIRKPPQFRERSMRYASDVRKIWYCRLFERPWLYVIPHLAVAATLWFLLGPTGMLWCLYVPMLIIYNVTWSVNSICHMPQLGYRSFETSDQSRNNFWIGVIGFGEGYHNNHHAQPRCAAHGLRWWEFDLTRYIIWTLEKCGLAWKVVWPATETQESTPSVTEESPSLARSAETANALQTS
ncbi:MAG: sn stearoyl-lipid 9-desaturase [Verrucomicrobiota bacterium]|jgi:stearoyl-CoA desaturase (delta-9 desaturase)